jgi:hypothetical protein
MNHPVDDSVQFTQVKFQEASHLPPERLLEKLDDSVEYEVFLDGVTRLMKAPGSLIKSLRWDYKTAQRLRFRYQAWVDI